MRNSLIMAGALGLVLVGTGCATKKYVAKTVSPVEAHVGAVESKNDQKNAEQDKQIAEHGQALADHKKELDEIGTDLSRTKERVTDVDTKAGAAGQAANPQTALVQ